MIEERAAPDDDELGPTLLALGLGLGVPRVAGDEVQLNAGVIGLYHGAHPARIVATVLAEPEFAPLRVDLRRELTHLTRALVGAIPCKDQP